MRGVIFICTQVLGMDFFVVVSVDDLLVASPLYLFMSSRIRFSILLVRCLGARMPPPVCLLVHPSFPVGCFLVAWFGFVICLRRVLCFVFVLDVLWFVVCWPFVVCFLVACDRYVFGALGVCWVRNFCACVNACRMPVTSLFAGLLAANSNASSFIASSALLRQ
jgi:hypothetical protein